MRETILWIKLARLYLKESGHEAMGFPSHHLRSLTRDSHQFFWRSLQVLWVQKLDMSIVPSPKLRQGKAMRPFNSRGYVACLCYRTLERVGVKPFAISRVFHTPICYHASIKGPHHLKQSLWSENVAHLFVGLEVGEAQYLCHADEPLAVLLDGLNLDDKLHFVEEPVEIVGSEVKRLKRNPLVKVRWNSKRDESIYDACTRLKNLIQRVPHHGLDLLSLTQFFYDHVDDYTRMDLDFAADGNLKELSGEEAWEAIENFPQGQKE
ncbi:hypothetical protein Tco_1343991 [Tanacetum coccineum]